MRRDARHARAGLQTPIASRAPGSRPIPNCRGRHHPCRHVRHHPRRHVPHLHRRQLLPRLLRQLLLRLRLRLRLRAAGRTLRSTCRYSGYCKKFGYPRHDDLLFVISSASKAAERNRPRPCSFVRSKLGHPAAMVDAPPVRDRQLFGIRHIRQSSSSSSRRCQPPQ